MRVRSPDSPCEVFVFAGPTLAASARGRSLARGLRLRPPVKRGDVAALVARHRAPGVLALVDGLFHDALSVGHAEIREAMRRGWRVWGLSSMGAIRAREMAPLGMRGFGRVFARFMEEDDFQDDEVALLHEAAPLYRSFSEPLIHLRAAIEHLREREIVTDRGARAVTRELKARWYGERTLPAAIELLAPHARASAALRQELRDFRRFALKTLDLERFLSERPWMTHGGGSS
jgi:hypothetical protein